MLFSFILNVYCFIKCMCLLRLLSNVKCFFGYIIDNGILGKLGLVFMLIRFLLLMCGVIVREFRICFIIICLGLCIEVRLNVLFYLCICVM